MQADSTQLLPLRDIHDPAPVSWWPLSPAMWLVIVLLIVSLAALLVWMRKRRHHHQFSRDALQSLEVVERRYHENHNVQGYLIEMSALLRRLLMSARDGHEISRLRGENWCDYLNSIIHHSGCKNPVYFSPADFRLMDHAVYRKSIKQHQIDVLRIKQSTQQLIAGLSAQKLTGSPGARR